MISTSLSAATVFNPGPENRVSGLEAETPRRKPEIRLPKLQILQTKPEIHPRNAAISDSRLSFWRGIHTFPDRSGEISDRIHTFEDRKRDSLSASRDSGLEFTHSRTEIPPPGTETRDSPAETRDSGGESGACASALAHPYIQVADRAFVPCDLILYLLLLKEKEDHSGPGCPYGALYTP